MGSLQKHVGKKRNKERYKIMDIKCAHAKMRLSMLP